MDARLQHPFSCIIARDSGSGKTVFVTKLIKHVQSMINPPPEKIVWHYGEWQSLFEPCPMLNLWKVYQIQSSMTEGEEV